MHWPQPLSSVLQRYLASCLTSKGSKSGLAREFTLCFEVRSWFRRMRHLTPFTSWCPVASKPLSKAEQAHWLKSALVSRSAKLASSPASLARQRLSPSAIRSCLDCVARNLKVSPAKFLRSIKHSFVRPPASWQRQAHASCATEPLLRRARSRSSQAGLAEAGRRCSNASAIFSGDKATVSF